MGSSQQDGNPGTLSITVIFKALQSLAWCLCLKEKDIAKCTGQAWCFNDTTESQEMEKNYQVTLKGLINILFHSCVTNADSCQIYSQKLLLNQRKFKP